MPDHSLIYSIFVIFAGAAVLSTVALYTRQSLLVAFIVLGVILGPWGLNAVGSNVEIEKIGDVGIVFLLFLLGLNLHPQKLINMLTKVSWVTLVSSGIFLLIGYGVGRVAGYSGVESIVIGASMMFSSTIIGLKLMPTTALHHRHTGELMIGVLLLQDLLAIFVLLMVHAASMGALHWQQMGFVIFGLPGLIVFAFLFERFILRKLFRRFDRFREYMFLLSIAWCLGMAQLAYAIGLTSEVGAFIAGVSIAASPVSFFIADSLKPIRDFFLVLFFFSVGAGLNVQYFKVVAVPAIFLAGFMLLVKPYVFKILFQSIGENRKIGYEVGVRLGQASEFSLLIAYLAVQTNLLSASASNLIQSATVLTFIVSSYWVVLKFPTPISITDHLRRD